MIRQEAIDNALLAVKVEIESVKNKQFKLNAKLKIENKWVLDTQTYKRRIEKELEQQHAVAAQEQIKSLIARNDNLTEGLFFARARIQALINVIDDKDSIIAEKENFINLLKDAVGKIEIEKECINNELERKIWRLDNAVFKLAIFERAAERQRDKDDQIKEDEVRQQLFIKKLQRRIKFLENIIALQGTIPEYPIDILF